MSLSFHQLNLNEHIQRALKACGYTKPTPVQAAAIPEILAGKDVVACAQTGTGKTAAFVLPALEQLSKQESKRKTKILILTPTRELASQITKAAAIYGKFLRYNIVSLVGGMPYHHQIKDLARGAEIIVATPGRLLDHIEQKRVDLSHVEMLVLDEADRMLDMGFIDDVNAIAKLTPSTRQTLLFSATIDKQLTNVIRQLLKNPVQINLSNEKIAAPKIKQILYRTKSMQHKTELLKQILSDENIFKAIIFSATKINADKLANQLAHDGFAAAALHGDLRQNVRNRTIDSLRRGRVQFLVATDVAARGLDISDITHVINYDLPKFSEDYVHRIGRTGRAGKDGIAISFVSPQDAKHLQGIERYLGQRLSFYHPETGEQDTSFAEPFKEHKKPSRDKHKPRREFSGFKKKDHGKRFESDKPRAEHRGKKKDDLDDFADLFEGKPSHKPNKRFANNDGWKSRAPKSDRFSKDKNDSFEQRAPKSNRFGKDKNESWEPGRAPRKNKFGSDKNDSFENRAPKSNRFGKDKNDSWEPRAPKKNKFGSDKKDGFESRAPKNSRFSKDKSERRFDKPRDEKSSKPRSAGSSFAKKRDDRFDQPRRRKA